MKFTTITSIEEFSALEPEFHTLLAQCSGKLLFMTFEYLISWLTTIGSEKEFKILLAREGHELVGVCPLVDQSTEEERRRGMTTVAFCGEGLWGYADFVCIEEEKPVILPRFMDELLSGKYGDFLQLGPFIVGSSTEGVLDYYLTSNRIPVTKVSLEAAPFIDTAIGIENFKKTLARRKSVTSDIARCERLLAELGKISVCRLPYRASRDELKRHLTGFLDLYLKQWPETRFERNPAFRDLYLDFAYRASQEGFLDFSFLQLNDRPVAYHYGFIHKRCLYYFTPTFDVEYRKYSPGKILLRSLIEKSFAENVEFDFQNAVEPYKLEWTQAIRERILLRIPASAKARLYSRLKRSASKMRRTVSRVRHVAGRVKARFL